jgi:hypothetical protein
MIIYIYFFLFSTTDCVAIFNFSFVRPELEYGPVVWNSVACAEG